MKTLALLSLLVTLASTSWAKTYLLEQAKTSYQVKHLIKTVDGISNSVKGKIFCENKQCEFLLAIRVDSFKSSDSNRDLNMLTILEADKYPLITIKGVFKEEQLTLNDQMIQSKISFHGIEKDYPLSLSQLLQGEGKLTLNLEDHQVERPSLLTVKIDKLVPITFSYKWKEQ